MTVWDYRFYIIAAITVILTQSLLIILLLIHKRRRKAAESSLRHKTEELNERLMLESLLSDISAKFVNMPAASVEGLIQETLHRLCERLGVDHSALWQFSIEEPRLIYITHFVLPPGGPPVPERMEAHEYFPWCLEQVKAGKVIAASTEGMPAEAARDQEVLRYYGIQSFLILPLSVGGEPLIGALSFAAMRENRTWPEPFVKKLETLVQVFANALARKRSEQALRESEDRLKLAVDSARSRPLGILPKHWCLLGYGAGKGIVRLLPGRSHKPGTIRGIRAPGRS